MKKTLIALAIVGIGTMAYAQQKPEATNLLDIVKKIEYPKEAREKGLEGDVKVKFTVSEDGTVMRYSFIENNYPVLQEALSEAMQQIRFSPGKDETGRETIARITLKFSFNLNTD